MNLSRCPGAGPALVAFSIFVATPSALVGHAASVVDRSATPLVGGTWQLGANAAAHAAATPEFNVASGHLTLTNASPNEATCATFSKLLNLSSAWSARFDYVLAAGTTNGGSPADGFYFVLQDQARQRPGGAGGRRGLPSAKGAVAIGVELFGTPKVNVCVDGRSSGFTVVKNINFHAANDPIAISVKYDGVDTLYFSAVQNGRHFSRAYHVNIARHLLLNQKPRLGLGYIGFTGATGASSATQVFSKISFQARRARMGMWRTLKVVKNHLVNGHGKKVVLRGVAVPSLEWTTRGEHILRSIREAVCVWHANVVRLPLAQDYWFGKGPGQHHGGAAYRRKVRQAVATVRMLNAYMVLDLHHSDAGVWGKFIGQKRMPDRNSVTFWKSVGKIYGNNPCVLFDLYNEPHNVSWAVWRNGGMVSSAAGGHKTHFQSPGMQGLLNAVRSVGARNVAIVGGLDWAYDLRGVLHGYALHERGGNGIMYAAHIYPWKKHWMENVGVLARKYPVFIGEVGCSAPGHQIIGNPDACNPYRWAPRVLAFIQQHHFNWTAWSFHPKCAPDIVRNWKYQPTAHWGAFVRAALAGTRFIPPAK